MLGYTSGETVLLFGPFEADLKTQELRRGGVRLRLPGQSFQILAMLLQRSGQLVTREELQQALWPADTFVDFEKGINAAINRLRDVLGDSAESPRYVETLPRRGYRLIVPVIDASPVSTATVVPVEPILPVSTASRKGHVALAAAVVAVLLIAGAAAVWKVVARAPAMPSIIRFTQLTSDGESKAGPMATDGASIYFNEVLAGPQNRIARVSIHGGEAVPMPVQLKQPTVFDVSKDGTELLLADDEGHGYSFWIGQVAGGSPRRLGTVFGHDARFNPDSTKVILGTGHDVYLIDRDGSAPEKVLSLDDSVAFAFQYSPDGRRFRFSTFNVQIDSMSILEALANGADMHTTLGGCCGRWTSDGRYFIFQNRRKMRLDIWMKREAGGFLGRGAEQKESQLTAGPLDFEYPLPSKDNKQIFAIGTTHRAEMIRYDLRTAYFIPFLPGVSAEGIDFSDDGQWIAYTSFPDGTLWRSRVDGSERRQLTFAPLRAFLPRWSPDGSHIAFNADVPEVARNVYVISGEGGTPERILPSEQSQSDVDWSADGKSLIFSSLFVPGAPIYSYELKSKRLSTLADSNGLFAPRLSPDGKYVTATTTDGPSKLMLFDFSTQKWTQLVDSKAGNPAWSHDGKYVYFQDWEQEDGTERIRRVRVSDRKLEAVADVKKNGRLTTGTFVDWFGLAPDDSPLLARDISSQELYAIDVRWP